MLPRPKLCGQAYEEAAMKMATEEAQRNKEMLGLVGGLGLSLGWGARGYRRK